MTKEDLTKYFNIIKPYLKSKRTWIVIGMLAVDFTGLLPDKAIHYITALSVIATKVIDTLQGN